MSANFTRFFRLFKDCCENSNYLVACLLVEHLQTMRRTAVSALTASSGARALDPSILARKLMLKSSVDAESFLEACGYSK